MKKKSYNRFIAASVSATVIATAPVSTIPFSTPSAEAAVTAFSDVHASNYFAEAVLDLSQQGIINGFSDGTFRPNQKITRSQAAAILASALDLEVKNVKDPGFKDVPSGIWYYGAVAALVEKGIVSGVDQNHFSPDRPITRAEMAKILSLGYNLKASSIKTNFTDVPEKSWFSGYVGAIADNKITAGVSSTAFAPSQAVTRGQMAAFVHRSEKQKSSIIEKITDDSITINGNNYAISESMKKILNPLNEAALKNALIKFEETSGTINKVSYLELKASGSAAIQGQPETSGHLILDGQGGVIDGDVKISGDYLSIKNVTVKGNFEISSNVQNGFFSDNLKVEGETSITDTTLVNASSENPLYYQAAAEEAKKINIVFKDSALNTIKVSKSNITITYQGTTSLLEVILSANASVSTADGILLPKVVLKDGAKLVELNAKVSELVLNDTNPITINGLAKIENILLPIGTTIKELLNNYDEIKENIEKIDGVINPDLQISLPPTSLPPSQDIVSSTPVLDFELFNGFTLGSTVIYFNSPVENNVFYQISDQSSGEPAAGIPVPEGAIQYIPLTEINNIQPGQYLQVFMGDSNNNIIDFKEILISQADLTSFYQHKFIYDKSAASDTIEIKFNAELSSETLSKTQVNQIIDILQITNQGVAEDFNKSGIASMSWDTTNVDNPKLVLIFNTPITFAEYHKLQVEFLDTVKYLNEGARNGVGLSFSPTTEALKVEHIVRLAFSPESQKVAYHLSNYLSGFDFNNTIDNINYDNDLNYLSEIQRNADTIINFATLQQTIDEANKLPYLNRVYVSLSSTDQNKLRLEFSEPVWLDQLLDGTDFTITVPDSDVPNRSIKAYTANTLEMKDSVVFLTFDGPAITSENVVLTIHESGRLKIKDVDQNGVPAVTLSGTYPGFN